MASTQSKFPIFIAATIGAAGAYYIVSPKVERSGKTPGPTPTEGRGQSAISGKQKEESPSSHSPHPALKYGGAAPGDDKTTTVAGTSQQSRKSYSADHDVKTRDNPKGQDGTNGGGVGVAEMRERKMQGQGLPSPQGGDTKAQPVEVQQGYNDGQGPKQSRGWFGFGGSK